MQKAGSSNPGRIKPMTYKIDTCRFLVWRSILLKIVELDKDWLNQYQDNPTEWDIVSCSSWTVVVCTNFSSKEPHRQVGLDRVVASGSLGSVMVTTLALEW